MSEGNGGIYIPKWGVWVAGCIGATILALAVPWAVSVDGRLRNIELMVQVERGVASKLHAHIADPNIHQPALRVMQKQIEYLERRIKVLEERAGM